MRDTIDIMEAKLDIDLFPKDLPVSGGKWHHKPNECLTVAAYRGELSSTFKRLRHRTGLGTGGHYFSFPSLNYHNLSSTQQPTWFLQNWNQIMLLLCSTTLLLSIKVAPKPLHNLPVPSFTHCPSSWTLSAFASLPCHWCAQGLGYSYPDNCSFSSSSSLFHWQFLSKFYPFLF